MKKVDIDNMIAENELRKEKLFPDYDPHRGIGSPLKRKRLEFDNAVIYVPEFAFDDPTIHKLSDLKSIKALASYVGVGEDEALQAIYQARFKHDFEFWAITCVKILDKEIKEYVPFRLRAAQRKLLARFERMRIDGEPIRLILLKARQWGGSTLTQIYMSWIQLFHKKNWHSAIVADVEDQAKNIRSMFTKLAERYPKDAGSITLKPYEGSTKNRMIVERGNILGIGSAKKPDNLRSFDYAMLHLSEVGVWKDTPMQSPDDLVQALRGGVGQGEYSMVVMESTAKGVGNLFHKEWQQAKKGDSGYDPVFVAWWEIEIYRKEVEKIEEFIEDWTARHWELWDMGATIEGIYWYFWYMNRENYDEWRMKEEFPSTPKEAFQTSGKRYYEAMYINNARKDVMEPKYIGDLVGRSNQGPDSLKDLRFVENSKGNLKVWIHPEEAEYEYPVGKRGAAFMDIGGTTKDSDWSVIKVVDRAPILEGGWAECAAEWRGHIDLDLLAWKGAQIATWYWNALLAIEMNTLSSRGNNTDGIHYMTVFNEIPKHYRHLYARTRPEKLKDKPTQYGYWMTEASKDMICTGLKKVWRDGGGGYYERSALAVDEAAYFEIKENGKLGAVQGEHDDVLIATAGVKWLATDYMKAPFYIEESEIKQKLAHEADF